MFALTSCAAGGEERRADIATNSDRNGALLAVSETVPPALRSISVLSPSLEADGSASVETAPAKVPAAEAAADSSTSADAVADSPSSPSVDSTVGTRPTAQPAPDEVTYELVLVAELEAPIALAVRPNSGQRYVATLTGQVWLLDPLASRDDAADDGGQTGVVTDNDPGKMANATDSLAPVLVADIGTRLSQGCENGLLGIAFSPDGSQLYLSYTDVARNSRIAVVPMDGDIPQMDRRRVLLALDQPACNHNGGNVAIGPDGNLWIAFGDGGGADDVFGQGQDPTTLLGAIARIDPNPASGQGYGIPDGNPFASSGAPEVWAYGARNPWRFSFDRLTGDLWIGDVGQNRIEEIHVLAAADGWTPGANLGWPLFEGNERFDDGHAGAKLPTDLVFPVYIYDHDEGCSVTGGYVYRGSAIAALAGTYVFGDYCTGALWGLVRGADGEAERIDLGVSVPRNSLLSFGEDADGELYVLSAVGRVFRLVAASS